MDWPDACAAGVVAGINNEYQFANSRPGTYTVSWVPARAVAKGQVLLLLVDRWFPQFRPTKLPLHQGYEGYTPLALGPVEGDVRRRCALVET